jgi:K+-transporting ATPase ATPase B chain
MFPPVKGLDFMHLASANSAVLSALIYNALIIPALIPLALRGVKFKAVSANRLLRDNILIYGLGGVIAPFISIKIIDLLIAAIGLA